jgi:hypothetical protein
MQRKFVEIVCLFLLSGLMVALWNPRTASGQTTADELLSSLPSIAVDVDIDGTLTVQGMPLSRFSPLLGAQVANVTINPVWVELLRANNIQHIQIGNMPNELLVFANGEPLPSLRWDDQSLLAVEETLGLLGVQLNPDVDELLPPLKGITLGVIIRLPPPPNTPAIPLRVNGPESAAAVADAAQLQFLSAVGQPARIHVTLAYAADGTIAGLTGADLAALGVPLQGILRLPPGTVRQLSEVGIRSISLFSNPEGIFLAVNDRTFPHITWDEGKLIHLLRLLGQVDLIEDFSLGEETELLAPIEQLLPTLQSADLRLTVTFP